MTNKKQLTFDQQFLQDIVDEDGFKKALGKNLPKGLEDELSTMIRVYAEQLDGFVKNRFDVEIFRILAEQDPKGGSIPEAPATNEVKYKNAQESLRHRHITLTVVRQQILQRMGKVPVLKNDKN